MSRVFFSSVYLNISFSFLNLNLNLNFIGPEVRFHWVGEPCDGTSCHLMYCLSFSLSLSVHWFYFNYSVRSFFPRFSVRVLLLLFSVVNNIYYSLVFLYSTYWRVISFSSCLVQINKTNVTTTPSLYHNWCRDPGNRLEFHLLSALHLSISISFFHTFITYFHFYFLVDH
jgi:hypothetical protein